MLSIQSKGEIDVNALCLMGASVKDDDAIGVFGSGLKYAIACILREGISLTVHSGLREIKITTVEETFRGQSFAVIVIDGHRTSITTRTGPKWKIHEAVREIWSNALDEGEAVRSEAALAPQVNRTTITLGDHNEITAMLRNWSDRFLENAVPFYTCEGGEIHRQPSPKLFRKGVWICEEINRPMLFTYNFTVANSPTLPESRLVSIDACLSCISVILGSCTEKKVLKIILDAVGQKDNFEWRAFRVYSFFVNPKTKTKFKDLILSNFTHVGLTDSRAFCQNHITADQRVLWCEYDAYHFLANSCDVPKIEDAINEASEYEILPWPAGAEDFVKEHVAFLAASGIHYPEETTFHHAAFKEPHIIAVADTKKGRCILSTSALRPERIFHALVEEWTHLAHNVFDHTAAQQMVYLNLIVKLLKCESSNSSSPSPYSLEPSF